MQKDVEVFAALKLSQFEDGHHVLLKWLKETDI